MTAFFRPFSTATVLATALALARTAAHAQTPPPTPPAPTQPAQTPAGQSPAAQTPPAQTPPAQMPPPADVPSSDTVSAPVTQSPPDRPASVTPSPDRPAPMRTPMTPSPAVPAAAPAREAVTQAAPDAASPPATSTTDDPLAAGIRGPCDDRSRRPVFKLGQNHVVREGEAVRELVVVFGSADIEGSVCDDLVVVLGNVRLGPRSVIENSVSVIGGRLTVASGARANGDVVVVGGLIDAPSDFAPGRDQVLIGLPVVGDRLQGLVPWVMRGLLYGRLIVPDLAWNWYVVGVTLFVLLLLNLLFPLATARSAMAIERRPLSTFAVGLLVLVLAGPVLTLLAVTVIGIIVIPLVLCALLAASVVGVIAVGRWIGTRVVEQSDPASRVQATVSFLLGFAVLVVALMIPVLGLTTWALTGVLGLGGATMALVGAYRTENPRPTPPAIPPSAPPPHDPMTALPPLYLQDEWVRDAPPGPSPGPAVGAEGVTLPAVGDGVTPPVAPLDLRRFPRGRFLERLAAFALDVILVGIANGVMDLTDREGAFFILLLAYHVIFWAWKSTTVGGIIMQLRIVRVDGAPMRVVDALVRGLTGVFSVAALGVGLLWILRDAQLQSWHDKVAGTLVVKVPRDLPLP